MNEIYEHLIYSSEFEKEKVLSEIKNDVFANNPTISPELIESAIDSKENNIYNCEFDTHKRIVEGKRLFKRAEEKFGNILWANDNLDYSNCNVNCPFGEICRKAMVQIGDKKVCYGQLYHSNITEEDLKTMAKNGTSVKLYSGKGSLIADLNSPSFDEQILSAYYFEHETFIWEFGDIENNKVIGGNVIPFL